MRKLLSYSLDKPWPGMFLLLLLIGLGVCVLPISGPFPIGGLAPAVDAFPEMGDNQQIVWVEWEGHPPEDIIEKLVAPVEGAMKEMPGLQHIRSQAMHGHANIYLIFEPGQDFESSRDRVKERLDALPDSVFPYGARPVLGPPSTAMGQVFAYALQGLDAEGKPSNIWSAAELNRINRDWVIPALSNLEGLAEAAPIGGAESHCMFWPEPEWMATRCIRYQDLQSALAPKRVDSFLRAYPPGMNQSECEWLSHLPLTSIEGEVFYLEQLGRMHEGKGHLRGILDIDGQELAGAWISVKKGHKPRHFIRQVQHVLDSVEQKLPKMLDANGKESRISIQPFYDRALLIDETLGTLSHALSLEMIVTMIVVLLLSFKMRSSLLISSILPLAVLFCFILMRGSGMDANLLALAGIAIAIGTMVDMAIVIQENIDRHAQGWADLADLKHRVLEGTMEVATAVLTSVATTIISFLPIFALQAEEGQLFRPLAFTKTFALLGAVLLSLYFLPIFNYWLRRMGAKITFSSSKIIGLLLALLPFVLVFSSQPWLLMSIGLAVLILVPLIGWGGKKRKAKSAKPSRFPLLPDYALAIGSILAFGWLWRPFGESAPLWLNLGFSTLVLGLLVAGFWGFYKSYERILSWCLRNKRLFLVFPVLLILSGLLIWRGWQGNLGWVQGMGWVAEDNAFWKEMEHKHPGLETEFMPSLDEGTLLLMPSLDAVAEWSDVNAKLKHLDMALSAIPEVELVAGKAGRAQSGLDPAPRTMLEVIVQPKPEFSADADGNWHRNWGNDVKNKADLHEKILRAANIQGLQPSPILQPIETRNLMLQTGIQSKLAVKVLGLDADSIELASASLAEALHHYEAIDTQSIFHEQILRGNSLRLDPNPVVIELMHLDLAPITSAIEVEQAGLQLPPIDFGGYQERISIRRPRLPWNEGQDSLFSDIPLCGITLPMIGPTMASLQPATHMLRTEDARLINYVTFQVKEGHDLAAFAKELEKDLRQKAIAGWMRMPADVEIVVTGEFEKQARSDKMLGILLPLSILLVLAILLLQFRSVWVSLSIFSGVLLAFAGGFWMIWLFGQQGFLDFEIMGHSVQSVFGLQPVKMSVAVWIGFIALLGIATEDGVVLGTYIRQMLEKQRPDSREGLHQLILEAGRKRIRPCLMTVATTMIALLPILSSKGRGADLLQPMAVPLLGGMAMALLTLFVVPVLYSAKEERKLEEEKMKARFSYISLGILLALGLGLALGFMLAGRSTPTSEPNISQSGHYSCPMDPQVLQDQPGNCPVCGMSLSFVPAGRAADEANLPQLDLTKALERPTQAVSQIEGQVMLLANGRARGGMDRSLVVIGVDIEDMPWLDPGDTVWVERPASPGKMLPLELLSLAWEKGEFLDRTSVLCTAFSGQQLAPGELVVAHFPVPAAVSQNWIMVPMQNVLLQPNALAYGYVRRQGMALPQFDLRKMRVAAQSSHHVFVEKGLLPGEELVTDLSSCIAQLPDSRSELYASQSAVAQDSSSGMKEMETDTVEALEEVPPVEPALGSQPPISNGEVAFKSGLKKVLSEYYELKDGLTAGKPWAAASSGSRLLQKLNALPDLPASDANAAKAKTLVSDLKSQADQISGSKQLDLQRNHFAKLSQQMIALLKLYPAGKAWHHHCPMALHGQGAEWLSPSQQIFNPYFGEQMLHCGKAVEKLGE